MPSWKRYNFYWIIFSMGLISFLSGCFSSKKAEAPKGSIYDFTINSIEGTPISFRQFEGKKILIVNTASKCGFTPQYEDLENLHKQFGDQVVVLGFPANDFLWQEPGSNEEIVSFCQKNYGVTFQLFEKISVKGKDQHPLYQWLEGVSGKRPSWNFCKYLIDEHGQFIEFFGSKVNPMSDEIVRKIAP
jgi:glutathione peroxidase